jgi:hypothetical protein
MIFFNVVNIFDCSFISHPSQRLLQVFQKAENADGYWLDGHIV